MSCTEEKRKELEELYKSFELSQENSRTQIDEITSTMRVEAGDFSIKTGELIIEIAECEEADRLAIKEKEAQDYIDSMNEAMENEPEMEESIPDPGQPLDLDEDTKKKLM